MTALRRDVLNASPWLDDPIRACWKDEAWKARFMADPKAVLAEFDMDVPANIDVKVVENSDNCVHITMPAAPAGAGGLSDEELSNAAGGQCCSSWNGPAAQDTC